MTDQEAAGQVIGMIQAKIQATDRRAWASKVDLACYANAGDPYTSPRVQEAQAKLRTANATTTHLHNAIHVIQQLW